jgi:hypothetical protein
MWLYTLIFLLVVNFGSIISLLLFLGGSTLAQEALAMKDLTLMLGVMIAGLHILLRRNELPKNFKILLAWTAMIFLVNILSFVLSQADMQDKIVNFRRNTAFVLVLMVFSAIGHGFRSFKTYDYIASGIVLILLTIGVLDYVAPDPFWDSFMQIPEYWRRISVDPFATDTIATNGRFYSWDLLSVVGKQVRRMVSLYLEPTTLAACLSAGFCVAYAHKRRFLAAVIAVLGSLTISKFFVMSLILTGIVVSQKEKLRPRLFIGVIGVFVLISVAILALQIESGAFAHLKGVVSLLDIFSEGKIFGFGLGGAGNYTAADSEAGDLGSESGVGNLVAQLGLGALVYLAFFQVIFSQLVLAYQKYQSRVILAAVCCFISWVMSFMLSASSLGLSGNAMFFIFIGCVLFEISRSEIGAGREHGNSTE